MLDRTGSKPRTTLCICKPVLVFVDREERLYKCAHEADDAEGKVYFGSDGCEGSKKNWIVGIDLSFSEGKPNHCEWDESNKLGSAHRTRIQRRKRTHIIRLSRARNTINFFFVGILTL